MSRFNIASRGKEKRDMRIFAEGDKINRLNEQFRCCESSVRFYGPALYPLDVRVLRFIDTPLRLIEEHSFLGVNRTLQELYVINSDLEQFPREALQVLGNLSLLSIAGHRISTLPGNSFSESAAASKMEKLEISNGNHNFIAEYRQ